jgi:CDP-glucose 4,6-dehydratase
MERSGRLDFRGLRVLVTGDTGFKGSWLSSWLLELGAEVSGYALPPLPGSHFELLGLGERMRHQDADVRDLAALRAAVRRERPELVLHLAAQSLVRPSYEDPVGTIATNVLGTAHVLEALRSAPDVRAAVIVTSDKCYENREWVWAYRENDAMGGHDPYSASKGAAELVVSSFRRSFFAPGTGRAAIASVRAGNVIGGGDWSKDRLIPDCARALLADETVVLRNPKAVRPWQHVLEPLSGYLLLARRLLDEPGRFADAYNFGPRPGDALTVEEIAREFVRVLGRGRIEVRTDPGAPHEAGLLRLACEKAEGELGIRPLLSPAEAVAWTVEWYKTFRDDPAAAADLTRRQIVRYEERVNTESRS